MKSKLFFLVLIVFLAGCTEQPAPPEDGGFARPKLVTREDSLEHDVLEGHDYGMARMMKISKYRAFIRKQLGTSGKEFSPRYKDTLLQLDGRLSNAETLMNQWMDNFRLDSFQSDPEKRVLYLEGEKRKIEIMKEAIAGSLAAADSLFPKK